MAITIRSSCISVPLFRAADVVGVDIPAVRRGAVGQPACHRERPQSRRLLPGEAQGPGQRSRTTRCSQLFGLLGSGVTRTAMPRGALSVVNGAMCTGDTLGILQRDGRRTLSNAVTRH